MQFLLLMHGTPPDEAPGDLPLRPPADATTLRGWGEALTIEPGPMPGSAETIVGARLIDAPDLAAAAEVAAGDPWAVSGDIEIREIWADFGTPEEVMA